ncbi:hypothetical protein DZC78_00615 [Olleya aquimaris]|nr:hypothetical protein DZC78_00615 [Olleya aquimaris]
MRGLALNFASTHQVGNSCEISKEGENKQLLIAIVVWRFFVFFFILIFSYSQIISSDFFRIVIFLLQQSKSKS